ASISVHSVCNGRRSAAILAAQDVGRGGSCQNGPLHRAGHPGPPLRTKDPGMVGESGTAMGAIRADRGLYRRQRDLGVGLDPAEPYAQKHSCDRVTGVSGLCERAHGVALMMYHFSIGPMNAWHIESTPYYPLPSEQAGEVVHSSKYVVDFK